MNSFSIWKATTDLCAASSIPWLPYNQKSGAHFGLNQSLFLTDKAKLQSQISGYLIYLISKGEIYIYVALHTLTLRLFVLWQILVAPKQKQVVQPLGLAESR